MFTSPILYAAISVSKTAVKPKKALRDVKITVKPGIFVQFTKLYLARAPTFLGWGAIMGASLFWPLGAAEIVKVFGVNNV